MDPSEFVSEIFSITATAFAMQMDDKGLDELSAEVGEFQLTCTRAKLKQEYKH